jgi:hypothetical protein
MAGEIKGKRKKLHLIFATYKNSFDLDSATGENVISN